MPNNFEEIINQIKPPDQEPITVDMSDLLGEGAIFRYRRPSIADLVAITEDSVIQSWRLKFPSLPERMIQILELLGRTHLEPKAQGAIGALYYELLESRLTPDKANQFLTRAIFAIAPWLANLEESIEAKKGGERSL